MKIIVIAKYNEDINWSNNYDNVVVVQKGRDLPNKGREASSYLWWIIKNYNDIPEKVHFLQGNPFAHTDENLKSTYFPESDKNGCALHCGLDIEKTARILGIVLPEKWSFAAGANIEVCKEEILKYSLD